MCRREAAVWLGGSAVKTHCVIFILAVIKHLTKSNLRRKGFILTYGLRKQSPSWPGRHRGRSWRQLVPLHLRSGSEVGWEGWEGWEGSVGMGGEEVLVCIFLSPFHSVLDLSPGAEWVRLDNLINSSQICLEHCLLRDSRSCKY